MEHSKKTLLLNEGLAGLNHQQIQTALKESFRQKIPVHKCIYNLGFTDENTLLTNAANAVGVDFLESIDFESEASSKYQQYISANIATHYHIVPVSIEDHSICVATSDPFFHQKISEIEIVLNNSHNLDFCLAESDSISKAIRKLYGIGAATVEQMAVSHDQEQTTSTQEDLAGQDTRKDASVIKLVNQLLADAINSAATDIHIEPYGNDIKAKYRIDGMLHDAGIPPTVKLFREGITSRIKILAGLDIAEKRLPQDGRAQITLSGQQYDLRISILPTRHGEAVNIRILPQSRLIRDLLFLGMAKREVDLITELIHRPHGIILVTGPTGSGKTTTLYTCMHMLKDTARKIITIEDPIEYEMDGIVQMQVHSYIGFTFARALRSMLRHDPDIMLVGEIRDLETADTAIRTALTGHLVFSTLHTNDAASAITRLLDMGIEPFLAASSIDAILAQRLVRVICPNCKETSVPNSEMQMAIKGLGYFDTVQIFYQGRGCSKCRFTGYHGRTVVTELLLMSETIREMTISRDHSNKIDAQARKEGMVSLFLNGLDKVRQGITTYEEVIRITKGTIIE